MVEASNFSPPGYQLAWYWLQWGDTYDTMWDPVMKAVPKVDESESGQMVLK